MRSIISVVGGKGGTGKTLLAVNIAFFLSKKGRVLLADLDVDNPCTRTFFRAKPKRKMTIKEFRPEIDEGTCVSCGACVENCQSHALLLIPGRGATLMPALCEGCGVCRLVCPVKAIKDSWVESGYVEEYGTVMEGLDLVVGELKPTTRRTPVMILKTLKYVKEKVRGYDYVVLDSPPGTGSGIYAIIEFSDLILAVTEPTKLGLADLKKLHKLYEEIEGKEMLVVINKTGLKGEVREELEEFLRGKGLNWESIPYDGCVISSYVSGTFLSEKCPDSPAAKAIEKITEHLTLDPKRDHISPNSLL